MKFTEENFRSQVLFHLPYISATILGNYARAGTIALGTYSPSYVRSGSVIWCNMTSCIIMGMLQELNAGKWFTVGDLDSLFTTLTTGFCGAYSSYSSLFSEIFEQSTNLSPSNIKNHTRLPNRAFGMKEFLAVLLSQMFTSMGGYLFGRGFSKSIIIPITSKEAVLESDEDVSENKQPVLEASEVVPRAGVYKVLYVFQFLLAFFAFPFMVVIIVLASVYDNYSRGKWTLFALFGIFGSYFRYYLSKWCNPWLKNFPMGTFIVNQFSVILYACFEIITRGRLHSHREKPVAHSINACHITKALTSGFCGSLSTISTLINEGYKLPFNRMLIYYFVSIFVSYSFFVIIMGSYSWTKGLTKPVC